MNDLALRRLDMALLALFREVMRQRNLTQAGKALGLTQSAVSHGLARLRSITGDDLFLRRPYGVEPTAQAQALEPLVDQMLALGQQLVAGGPAFVPADAQATIRIAAQDYHCALLARPFLAACAAEAPGVRASFRPLARQAALAGLAASEIDLAIGFVPALDERFLAEPLAAQGYALVARADHPRLATLGTLDGYCAERHLLVSQAGDLNGVADRALREAGRQRTVVAALPYYLPALAAVAESDLIATVPRLLAERYAARFGLAVLDPPVTLRRFRVDAVRHKRDAKNGLVDWAVERLRAAMAEGVSS